MSAIINVAFTGRLIVFLSKFEDLRHVIGIKTGLAYENMRIIHEGREMNQDSINGIDNQVFSLIIQRSNKEIIAQLESGYTVTIPISWDKKVADVKKWLDDKLAIEYNNMSLSYRGVRLQDEIVLATYFGDVIIARILVTKINKKEIVGYVDCRREGFESEVVRVAVLKTETVRRLKEKIEEKCSFELPAKSQMLRHREIMKDREEVGRYDIIDGERLASSYKPWMIVTLRNRSKSFRMKVSPLWTVANLKREFARKIDFHGDMRLFLPDGDQEMRDGNIIDECGVCEEDELRYILMYPPSGCPQKGYIIINWPLNTLNYFIPVSLDDTIGYVKRRIEDICGFRLGDLMLSFQGDNLDDNELTLMDCQIEYGDTLLAINSPRGGGYRYGSVTVTLPGGAREGMEIYNPLETVMDLRKRLDTGHGYRVDRHYLTTMEGDSIEDIHVLSLGDRYLLLPKIRVEINVICVNTLFDLRVSLNLSIWDIKTLISEEVGLKVEVQRLTHEGTVLKDNETVFSSPLGRGTRIKEVLCELCFDGEN